jgi:hypothetical protein
MGIAGHTLIGLLSVANRRVIASTSLQGFLARKELNAIVTTVSMENAKTALWLTQQLNALIIRQRNQISVRTHGAMTMMNAKVVIVNTTQ